MKKINLILVALAGALTLQAQDFNDALRCSESFVEGDARYMAMSGALSSLGGNVTAMSVNPASSASFKKSVFEITPSYIYTKSENYYKGYDKAFTSALRMPNLGFVYHKPMKQNDIFVSGLSFGFSMNVQNRYDETLNFTNSNLTSSLSDDFLRIASLGGGALDSTYEFLAYETYVLDYDKTKDVYYTEFVDQNGVANYDGVNQNIQITREGLKNEYLFNVGVNFTEWVYFGADLSIFNYYSKESRKITEVDVENKHEYLDQYTYMQEIESSGNGVAGKFGLIARPIEYIRVGAAVHTPVMMNISEDGESFVDAYYDKAIDENPSLNKYKSYQHPVSDYKIGQPAKFVGSLGFVYKNVLNIGVDFETMNYSQCTFTSDYVGLVNQSNQISDELKSVSNIKCGGEFRYGPFMFRAGYATYGNPYKNITTDKFYRNDVSAGVGLATNTVYCDLSWLRAKSKQVNDLYSDLNGDIVSSKSTIKSDKVSFTIGFKF